MADFLRLIDVNAGGFRLKKGQGILHPTSKTRYTPVKRDRKLPREQRRNGLSKSTLLDNRFSARPHSPLLWRVLILAESSIYATNLYHDTAPICIPMLLQKSYQENVKF